MRIKSQQFPNNVWVSSVTWASAYAEGSDMYPEVQEQSKIIKKNISVYGKQYKKWKRQGNELECHFQCGYSFTYKLVRALCAYPVYIHCFELCSGNLMLKNLSKVKVDLEIIRLQGKTYVVQCDGKNKKKRKLWLYPS